MADHNATLSVIDAPANDRSGRSDASLFVVLSGGLPVASRHSLDGIDTVSLERASRPHQRTSAQRHLCLSFADAWMSSKHARLRRTSDGWVVEDGPSKNGTHCNGTAVHQTTLSDGDVIEVGGTFLLFREEVLLERGEPLDLEATRLRPHAHGLATLVPALSRAFDRLAEIARSVLPVLIGGETGTGKELLARAVHTLSTRAGEFVPVNCGALPEALVESELFGYKKGAFSGATDDRQGLVRGAHRGTLFLDEIGELRAPSQVALLRVLQEREVRPLGAARAVTVDLRVVAATHRELGEDVQRGSFRADLLARLSGFAIRLPPLRERREDLGVLVSVLTRNDRGVAGPVTFARSGARALLGHAWPQNIRELERRLLAAAVFAKGAAIEASHLFPDGEPTVTADAPAEAAALSADDRARRDELCALLREHDGNVSATARAMGKARFQLQRWLKRYAIEPATCKKA